ncbi:hypothetical protein [Clostridium thailandense]|uniref:hypothetical protein n=1 Tax=Clostridium thailandense TaxID=2794346 RepID=UPI003989A789
MERLYYCSECKRVITNEDECTYCNSNDVKELMLKTPVNVIGTKTKGKVLKIKDGKVNLIIRDEANSKLVKEYDVTQLKKVL